MTFRSIRFYEFQIKKLFNENNLNVQRFQIVDNPQDAKRVGEQLMKTVANELMIKSQIFGDERDEIKFTKDPNQCANFVEKMLKNRFEMETKNVMIAEALKIVRKTFLSIVLNENADGPILIGRDDSHRTFSSVIDPFVGLKKSEAEEMAKRLGFQNRLTNQATEQIQKLYKFFTKYDCVRMEIDSFVETFDRRVMILDANLIFDENAKFRQTNLFAMKNVRRENFHLNGNIGVLVNGIGSALATMDLIEFHGGKTANFLEFSDSVNEDQILHALEILFNDNRVEAVLVNIFNGIGNSVIIANGIVKALKKCNMKIPIVLRFEGTNADEAIRIFTSIHFPFVFLENDFDRAAEKVVSVVQKNG